MEHAAQKLGGISMSIMIMTEFGLVAVANDSNDLSNKSDSIALERK